MRLGNLFAKLGAGETLTPGELNELRLQMNNLQSTASIVSKWVAAGKTDAYLPYMDAVRGRFDFPPLETARWRRINAQTVAHNTWTEVEWNEETWNTTGFFSWDSGTPANFTHPSVVGYNRGYLFAGFVDWSANSTGDRCVKFERDGAAGTVMLNVNNANAGGESDFTPFVLPYRITNPAVTGFSIDVHQNSGGNLNINSVWFGVMRML